jgi:hypothetical protein
MVQQVFHKTMLAVDSCQASKSADIARTLVNRVFQKVWHGGTSSQTTLSVTLGDKRHELQSR